MTFSLAKEGKELPPDGLSWVSFYAGLEGGEVMFETPKDGTMVMFEGQAEVTVDGRPVTDMRQVIAELTAPGQWRVTVTRDYEHAYGRVTKAEFTSKG